MAGIRPEKAAAGDVQAVWASALLSDRLPVLQIGAGGGGYQAAHMNLLILIALLVLLNVLLVIWSERQ